MEYVNDAQVRLAVAEAAFGGVRDHYRGLRRFKRYIDPKDFDVLNSCVRLLFSSTEPDSEMSPATADLIMEIGIYQARFSNTGVKAYRVPAGFE